MKILMVLTSHSSLGSTGKKTGFWLEEFAAPYYVFKDAGVEITLASPQGGHPPLDPKSAEKDFQTAATARFNADKEAQTALANTVKLKDISAADFDALFYPGGHGPLWDLSEDRDSIALIETMYAQGKPVAGKSGHRLFQLGRRGCWPDRGRAVSGGRRTAEKRGDLLQRR